MYVQMLADLHKRLQTNDFNKPGQQRFTLEWPQFFQPAPGELAALKDAVTVGLRNAGGSGLAVVSQIVADYTVRPVQRFIVHPTANGTTLAVMERKRLLATKEERIQ